MESFANIQPDLLISQAQQGASSALGRLLDLYKNYLATLARLQLDQKLKSKVDPLDVVQETFLKASHNFHQFRGATERELLGWLRQILARGLVDEIRRYHKSQRGGIRLEENLVSQIELSSQAMGQQFVAAQSTPSERASRREQAVLLADALAQLSDDNREVLVLRHLEELTFPEVAERLDKSLDSVKSTWRRSLVQLRRLIAGGL